MSASIAIITPSPAFPDLKLTLVVPHDYDAEQPNNVIALPRRRFKPSAARPRCFHRTSSGHCTNQTHWLINGKAHCKRHFDLFWDSHFVEDHRVVRLDQGDGY